MKRRTMVVEDAMFESGFERRDVRVTFRADMTGEEALQAGILLATEFMIHSDCGGGFTNFELRDLGVNWMCLRSAAEASVSTEFKHFDISGRAAQFPPR